MSRKTRKIRKDSRMLLKKLEKIGRMVKKVQKRCLMPAQGKCRATSDHIRKSYCLRNKKSKFEIGSSSKET